MVRFSPLILLLLFGCAGQKSAPPPGLLPPERFARVYADLLLAGVPGDSAMMDTTLRRRTIDSLLLRRGVSRTSFDSSVAWYNADVSRWREVMDSVTRALNAPSGEALP
jgi:hypothetical protein